MTMAPKEELTMTTHDTDAALPADADRLFGATQHQPASFASNGVFGGCWRKGLSRSPGARHSDPLDRHDAIRCTAAGAPGQPGGELARNDPLVVDSGRGWGAQPADRLGHD